MNMGLKSREVAGSLVVAQKDGETVLVQCKHWKAKKVGVATVREMFGILNSERVSEACIVTSRRFTDDAVAFAKGKPIELINVRDLLQMVKRAKGQAQEGMAITSAVAVELPSVCCPWCTSPMTARTAKKGSYAGKAFWGCELPEM